jgi:hypothetical protein
MATHRSVVLGHLCYEAGISKPLHNLCWIPQSHAAVCQTTSQNSILQRTSLSCNCLMLKAGKLHSNTNTASLQHFEVLHFILTHWVSFGLVCAPSDLMEAVSGGDRFSNTCDPLSPSKLQGKHLNTNK